MYPPRATRAAPGVPVPRAGRALARTQTRSPRYFAPVIDPGPYAPFAPAFRIALPFGLLAGVHLPPRADPVPHPVLARLHPDERDYARTLGGFRQVQFVGGRLALGDLLGELGLRRVGVLPNEHGAPALSPGFVASVSHKQNLAVALVARGNGVGIGVDLEDTDRHRPGVAARVLRAEELRMVEALPADRQWVETAIRFSVKESVYKALHPFLLRYIGFGEVAVWTEPDGNDRVEPFLRPGEGPFRFEARHAWIGNRVLSMVRARPASSGA